MDCLAWTASQAFLAKLAMLDLPDRKAFLALA